MKRNHSSIGLIDVDIVRQHQALMKTSVISREITLTKMCTRPQFNDAVFIDRDILFMYPVEHELIKNPIRG